MIRTYISIALKYLLRQPSYSVLSILGFSLAFASVFFIYSHVSYQNSFDKHVDTWDRVYRLSGAINLPDKKFCQLQFFINTKCGVLTQRSQDNHSVYTGIQLEFQMLAHRIQIKTEIGLELGRHCRENPLPSLYIHECFLFLFC